MTKSGIQFRTTILRIARDLASLIATALRSRAELTTENLFLKKQLALYLKRQGEAPSCPTIRARDAGRVRRISSTHGHLNSRPGAVARTGNALTLASTISFVSLLHYFRRDIPASLEAAAEASACTREYVLTFWLGFSNALHGWGVAHLADASGRPSEWDEGVAQIRENLEALRGAGARSFGSVGQALLAETYMLRERFDEAASALDEGLDLAAQVREGLWEAELHRLRGELSFRRGSEGEAVVHFERAIATARNRKQRSLELRALISLYRLVRSQAGLKRRDRIRMQLAQTSDSFTEGFDTPDLVEARALVVRP